MNRLRRRPHQDRHAAGAANRADLVQERAGCARASCRTRSPGSTARARSWIPAATAAPSALAEEVAAPRATTSSYAGSLLHRAAGRPACASAPCPRRSPCDHANMLGSPPAVTSFTMEAPASSAARATSALRVSTLTGRSGTSATSRSMTGTTRSHSSSAGTGPRRAASTRRRRPGCPRRPSTICSACFTASSGSREVPAVGEGIGRDVHDPHDERSLAQ